MLTWNRLDRTDIDYLALEQSTEEAQLNLRHSESLDDFEELLPSGD
jgi:hypothetical protein